MEYKYTESAEKELEEFKKEQIDRLQDFIRRRKYVYGDDVVEVTGSDVKEAKQYFKVDDRRRTDMRQIVTRVYLVMGVLLLFGGVFYKQIKTLMTDDPTQLMIAVMGVTLILASAVGNWFFHLRDQQREARSEFLRRENEKG